MSGPLTGLKVLEFASIGPGPYAGMLMADLGADILRLERGDASSTRVVSNDLLNRSRPSIAVDLKSDAGRDLVLELSDKADAVVEGFRPGVMERLGLGPDVLLSRNRRLVYGRMTGYGQSGRSRNGRATISTTSEFLVRCGPRSRGGATHTAMNLVGDFGAARCFSSWACSQRSSRRDQPGKVRWSMRQWLMVRRRCSR